MRSPLLGDFLQLRYVDLGPPPGDVGDRSRPVRNLSAELMTAGGSAGRSHFALVVLASSATTIERLLASCAAEPFLAGLRSGSPGSRARTTGRRGPGPRISCRRPPASGARPASSTRSTVNATSCRVTSRPEANRD